jgi:outer membrane protein assembly factor BamE (lipoprotein component of BamABCDE complex)
MTRGSLVAPAPGLSYAASGLIASESRPGGVAAAATLAPQCRHERRADRAAEGEESADVTRGSNDFGRLGLIATLAAAVLAVACAPTIHKHGHQFQDTDVAQIQNGMSQEQVKGVLGSPTTTATVGGGAAYYYIASTTQQTAFFKPDEVDRKVLAVYFGQFGAVERTAQYGLKDGKVINYSNETTKHHAKDEGILRALFRNLGTKQLGLE